MNLNDSDVRYIGKPWYCHCITIQNVYAHIDILIAQLKKYKGVVFYNATEWLGCVRTYFLNSLSLFYKSCNNDKLLAAYAPGFFV